MKPAKLTAIDAVIAIPLAAELLKVGPERIRQLVKDGHVSRSSHGRVTIRSAVHGYLAFRNDDDRRSSKSAAASRVQDARAREIQLRVAEREGRLVDLQEHLDLFAETFGTLKAGLAGLPAEVTTDRAMRGKIEAAINRILQRAADRFETATAEVIEDTKARGARR